MNKHIKTWLDASRPRTLPLSIAGILVGSGIAWSSGYPSLLIFSLAILTTLSFQILSNFANDYGDAKKGTDNHNRVGPTRAIQSGNLSLASMKKGIIFTSIISLLLTLSLIYVSIGKDNIVVILFFLTLGIISIIAAIKYTVGNTAYGYHGLGDISVFIFFGLVSVIGGNYLFSGILEPIQLLPAFSIGLLSTAVLNLNNMRDHVGDKLANKNTLVVLMGFKKSKWYHSFLILGGILSFSIFTFVKLKDLYIVLNLLPFVILLVHLVKVWKTNESRALDGQLKVVALTTFFVSLIWFIIQL